MLSPTKIAVFAWGWETIKYSAMTLGYFHKINVFVSLLSVKSFGFGEIFLFYLDEINPLI